VRFNKGLTSQDHAVSEVANPVDEDGDVVHPPAIGLKESLDLTGAIRLLRTFDPSLKEQKRDRSKSRRFHSGAELLLLCGLTIGTGSETSPLMLAKSNRAVA
jgi:hypothetical protein